MENVAVTVDVFFPAIEVAISDGSVYCLEENTAGIKRPELGGVTTRITFNEGVEVAMQQAVKPSLPE